MISVGIVGATGYTGVELLRLLAMHDDVEIKVVTSNSEKGKAVVDVFPGLRSSVDLEFVEHTSVQLDSCDVVFFATPHATAMNYVPKLLDKGCKVIDLSADFRITNPDIWQEWYKVEHACPELLKNAVYGLPELNREKIINAEFVANPGCYPTAISLALIPAIKNKLINTQNIIADAKSGVSGAGRKAALASQFSEVAESFKAYSVSGHRHLPEIVQTLESVLPDNKVNLTFTPHLVPMNRGIFATIYMKPLDHKIDMQSYYTDYYSEESFVDVMPVRAHPDTRSVKTSNTCRLALHPGDSESQPTVILSVIDNLVKGAAGQAIQNMNLMFGFEEGKALSGSGLVP